ncbi:MAG: hypothetical protein JJU11_13485 [Candidatus Sumerlaeia bacterium]|nr:hypothetical protein [Candidatus Sumerlaeia bacterium]
MSTNLPEALPIPHLPHRPQWRALWEAAWRMALETPGEPEEESSLFHAAFLPFWRRYAQGALGEHPLAPLDRFYAAKGGDGLVPGRLDPSGNPVAEASPTERGAKSALNSFRPPILSWVEWDYLETTGDDSRIEKVFPILAGNMNAYYKRRTLPDGAVWATPAETAMEDLPRPDMERCIDTTAQAALDCEFLAMMALHRDLLPAAGKFSVRYLELKELINLTFWDKILGAYTDSDGDGDSLGILHLGSYWTVLANLGTPLRTVEMINHLSDLSQFRRKGGLPCLAPSVKGYKPWGDGWAGGVSPAMTYMVARALDRVGDSALAHEIALAHIEQVGRVYRETGAFWDRYAPDFHAPARGAAKVTPGWTALGPVAMVVEYLLGIRLNVPAGEIIWRLFLDEDHGIDNLRFGDGWVSLRVAFHKGTWSVEAESTVALELILMGPASTRILELDGKTPVSLDFRG